MDQDYKLGPVAYLILGLIHRHGEMTPYGLKKYAQGTIGAIWSFPHAHLYSEPARLAKLGLLEETQEEGGRRRRTYSITSEGKSRLESWYSDPIQKTPEVRNLALLKLYFAHEMPSDDLIRLATSQVALHREKLTQISLSLKNLTGDEAVSGTNAIGRLGIAINEAYLDFWQQLLQHHKPDKD